MDTYSVETDNLGGLIVNVARTDGHVWLTSPSLPSWRATQDWIKTHRENGAGSAAAERLTEP